MWPTSCAGCTVPSLDFHVVRSVKVVLPELCRVNSLAAVQISIPQYGIIRTPESIIPPGYLERFLGAKQMREMPQWRWRDRDVTERGVM